MQPKKWPFEYLHCWFGRMTNSPKKRENGPSDKVDDGRKPLSVGKAILWFSVAVVVGLTFQKLMPVIDIGLSCHAKTLCSATFVSLRDPLKVDIGLECSPSIDFLTRGEVIRETREVKASFLGVFTQTAKFMGPYRGCVLKKSSGEEPNPEPARTRKVLKSPEQPWPQGNTVDLSQTDERSEQAIDLDKTLGPFMSSAWSSRAVIVVKSGEIVYEQYGPGFTKDTPILGWSMTKSIMSALIGIRAGEGAFSIDDPVYKWFPEWRNDNRSKITVRDLLHMNSGLQWAEGYTLQFGDVIPMLFQDESCSERPRKQPPLFQPGTVFSYASGTTNLLSEILRKSLQYDESYWTYPARTLFEKIGADSMIMETDRTGTFVGSSFSYATACDWARFGLLFLNDGVWIDGQRVLPEGWAEYSSTPTKQSRNLYGAHFWRSGQPHDPEQWIDMPDYYENAISGKLMPSDVFLANGFAGQLIAMIPSRDTVIVRLGYNVDRVCPGELIQAVLKVVP